MNRDLLRIKRNTTAFVGMNHAYNAGYMRGYHRCRYDFQNETDTRHKYVRLEDGTFSRHVEEDPEVTRIKELKPSLVKQKS